MEHANWFLILNPKAGGGKGLRNKRRIEQSLTNAGISYTLYETKHVGDAIEITKQSIEKGFRKFVVAGGDGTLNEVANGILGQAHVPSDQILLAQIPVGTGNDWRRTWKIPNSIESSINLLKNSVSQKQDVANISFSNQGKESNLWFINVAGCGFDAEVAQAANAAKAQGKSGILTYVSHLVGTLTKYKEPRVDYSVDNQKQHTELFAILAGICRFAGNAMKLVPDAEPSDGLFHLTIASKINRIKVIFNLPRLFTGSFTKLKEVQTLTCTKLEIHTPGLPIQADGESIGYTPAIFVIHSQKLNIVTVP